MTKVKDITGQKFGRLTVIGLSGRNRHKQTLWKCKCDCGNECVVSKTHLITGHTDLKVSNQKTVLRTFIFE